VDDVHVLPVNDLRPHEETRWCPCRPSLERPVEGAGVVVVHNSWDGREITERAISHAWGRGTN
jgi:hypothetical protein